MTEPTDAELIALIEKHLGLKPRRDDTVIDPRTGRFHDVQRYRDMSAEILAKWGTPPAVVGEPIGYLYCGGSYGDELQDWEIVADQHQCDKLNEHYGALGKEAKLPIYTTQQPDAKVDWIGASSHHLMQKPDCGGESCDCRSYCKKVGGHHG